MLWNRIWYYFKGYVIIFVRGAFPEKFLNTCARNNILLWSIVKKEKNEFACRAEIDGFKKMRSVCRKSGCNVRIKGKKGLPFIVHRYKKRKAFIIGVFIFILAINVLSAFIWDIEINGNTIVSEQRIRSVLVENGIKTGSIKYRIDTNDVVAALLMDINELAWTEVEIKGTSLKVSIAERKKIPKLVSLDEPCDIVAKKDGIINKVIAKKGRKHIHIGDSVKKGQILVSGSIESRVEGEEPELVHSIAQVLARTWYEGKAEVPEYVNEYNKTGKVVSKYKVELFGKKISLIDREAGYNLFEEVTIKKALKFGENVVFPFAFIIERFYEINESKVLLDYDSATRVASDEAYRLALEKIDLDATIINTKLSFYEEANKKYASVLIECNEDIGEKKLIGGN